MDFATDGKVFKQVTEPEYVYYAVLKNARNHYCPKCNTGYGVISFSHCLECNSSDFCIN